MALCKRQSIKSCTLVAIRNHETRVGGIEGSDELFATLTGNISPVQTDRRCSCSRSMKLLHMSVGGGECVKSPRVTRGYTDTIPGDTHTAVRDAAAVAVNRARSRELPHEGLLMVLVIISAAGNF